MKHILIKKLQQVLGYNFKKQELLNQALTHRSASSKHNERLEFLGDAILNFVMTNILYKNFSHFDEGQMSRIRSKLVQGHTLAKIAYEFNLGIYLKLGQGEWNNGGFSKESILTNTIEAIIGSIFLDSNIKTVENVIQIWYKKRLKNIHFKNLIKDPKTRLQEYLQSKCLSLPVYFIVQAYGEAHNQLFTVCCRINKTEEIISVGTSRKKAEQDAAYQALVKLGIE
ncbi:Ribonuclease 3 [Buchnera aphidicola (Phyllaphis fagi)]|uniref:ribonuclease III n=1 Tax=Buchnera aphidicola TaxID=9 RepID=UPI003464BF9B